MKARKRDRTEAAILQALHCIGAEYLLLDPFDILVLHRGQLFMLDAKSPGGRQTKLQQQLVAQGWPLHFVETPYQALAVLGVQVP